MKKHFSLPIEKMLPYFVIAIACSSIFFIELGDADEIWNYSFARNISKGLVPYRDFNIIQTPLSAFMAAVFLSIFGDFLFVFRVAGFVLLCFLFAIQYNLFAFLCKKTSVALLSTIMCIILIPKIYNYNHLMLSFVLIILRIELCELNRNNQVMENARKLNKYYAIESIVAGCAPLVKQTTGSFLYFAFIVIIFINLRSKRINLRRLSYQLIVSLSPMVLFVLYLFVTNSFEGFLDYAIWGISTFSHRYTFAQFIFSSIGNFLVGLIVLFCIVLSIVQLFRNREKREIIVKYLILFFAFSTIVFPLCDQQHFYLVFILILPLFFSLFNYKTTTQNAEKAIACIGLGLSIVSVLFNECFWVADYKLSSMNHYDLIPIESDLEVSLCTIDEYILNKEINGEKVFIADVSAAAIMIPIDHYNKDYDMLLVGNVGTKTIRQLTEGLSDSLVLVASDINKLGMQDYYPLISFIKEEGVYCEQVEGLEVYRMERNRS